MLTSLNANGPAGTGTMPRPGDTPQQCQSGSNGVMVEAISALICKNKTGPPVTDAISLIASRDHNAESRHAHSDRHPSGRARTSGGR